MKIAILSDIHGNNHALEAVLEHTNNLNVEHFFILGDLIGYYLQPEKIVKTIMSLPSVVIQGNHERIIAKVIKNELEIEEVNEKYGEGHQIALQTLEAEEINWLINLDEEKDIIVDGISIKLCHGAPGGPDEYLYPDISQHKLLQFCNSEYDYIFTGHTHYPFFFFYNNCAIVNVGSVGQSKDIGGVASWGILDTSNKTYIPYRTPYKVDGLIKEIIDSENSNMDYLVSVLKRNRYDL